MMKSDSIYTARVLLREQGVLHTTKSAVKHIIDSNIKSETIFSYCTMLQNHKNKLEYEEVSDPYKVVMVDSNKIRYKNKAVPFKWGGLGQIRDGKWDCNSNLEPLSENYVIEGLRQRFCDERDWEETVYVKHAREKLQSSSRKSYYNCSNIEEFIDNRCGYIDQLYSDVKENGFRSNLKTSKHRNENYYNSWRSKLDVIVVLSRDGEFFLHDGKHRLAIAKVLNLKLPVNILCRHRLWQDLREEVGVSGDVDHMSSEYLNLLNHPDLEDVLPRRN